MDLSEQIIVVAGLLEKYHNNQELTANALNWTLQQLNQFKRANKEALRQARVSVKKHIQPVVPPNDIEILLESDPPPKIVTPKPTDADCLAIVENQDSKLRSALEAMKMRPDVIDKTIAAQHFGRNHIIAAVNIASANLMQSGVNLIEEQNELRSRLEKVRQEIAEYGNLMCDARQHWVTEELRLSRMLVDTTESLTTISDVHNRALYQAALVRAKFGRNGSSNPSVNDKPGFGPTTPIATKPPDDSEE